MEKNDVQNCWCWWGWELGCTYKLERKEREKKRAARDVRAPFSFLAPGVSSFSGNPAIYSLSLFLFRQQFPPFFYIYFILFYFLLFLFLFGVCTPPHPSSSLDSLLVLLCPPFLSSGTESSRNVINTTEGPNTELSVSLKRSRDQGRGYGLDMHCRHSTIQLLLLLSYCDPPATQSTTRIV
jgi:hypothetical protein